MTRRWTTLDGTPPRIIAHRGASGERPEHTFAAYDLAWRQRADVLEPDLVMTRDGVLLVRHDRGLRRSTDIASRAAFAARARDGDWPVDDFDRAELRALHAIQPWPMRGSRFDADEAPCDFAQLLAWADARARESGSIVTLYPELKHPAEFAAAGLDPVPALVDALRDVDPARVRIWVQCFDAGTLRRVREATGLRCFLLLDEDADPYAALAAHGAKVDGFGIAKSLLHGPGAVKGVVAEAHARGLQAHAWTYRDDVLPAGIARVEEELDQAFALGIDALFCDFPATAIAHRDRA